MSPLKSAYELASERIIASKHQKEDEEQVPLDFVNIPEFSDREDRVLDDNETKLIGEEEEEEEIVEKEYDLRVEEPESVTYDSDILETHWYGHFFDYGGFARLNRTMAFGLSNRNVRVKVEIEPYLSHINDATKDALERLSRSEISPSAPKIFGVTVPTNLSHPGKKIVYTMIETSEKVHKDYVGKLNLVDEIWVATEYGKEILEKSNVHPPVIVMPLGVDTSRYHPSSGAMNFPGTGKFKFLSVFRWSYRKGYDILLKAYLEEFSADEDVSLVLVSRAVEYSEELGPQQIVEDFEGVKEQINKSEDELPHVALYTAPLREKNMPRIYNAADAFVLISRGEGFCLPILEASSCGLPIIASNVTAQTDYLTNENSYLVDPEDYVEVSVNGHLSKMAKLCHFYEGQVFPDFRRGSIEKTKEHMRNVFENYDEAKGKAEKLRSLIANNYTWDMAVDRVYKRLKEIS